MRLKIIAGNLAVVLLLGLSAYLFVGGTLRRELLDRVEGRLGSDRELFERSFRLSALELVDRVSGRAGERKLRDVFGGLDESARRTRAFEAAEATAAWLSDPARGEWGAPDIVLIADETGKALARNGARNVMFGKNMLAEIPALKTVLETGRAAHDVWREQQEKRALEVAVAPIHSDAGAILGGLIVGYDLSNGMAKREGELIGRDVAFLVDDTVYSSSLGGEAARDLKGYLFGPHSASTRAVLGGQNATSALWDATLAGEDYAGITARLPMMPSHPVAYAVLGNRSEATSMLSALRALLVLTVLGAILVVLYGMVVGNTLMRHIEAIEEGVLAVINGRTDLRLETESEELGGLAFRINQLLNVFGGIEEEASDDEGRMSSPGPQSWGDAAFAGEPAGGGRASAVSVVPSGSAGGGAVNADEPIDDEALAARLAAEEQGAYEARVYGEYVTAKQAAGENVSNIPQDRFHQRLAGRAAALSQKHGCRMVRFQVETQGDQVVLRPVLIR
ncbi:MAG: MXAN_5187 C-terminal domain-containing protein [Myxococcales bacterium]|jgi:hypothetical protein